jgi:hypothetical protein
MGGLMCDIEDLLGARAARGGSMDSTRSFFRCFFGFYRGDNFDKSRLHAAFCGGRSRLFRYQWNIYYLCSVILSALLPQAAFCSKS